MSKIVPVPIGENLHYYIKHPAIILSVKWLLEGKLIIFPTDTVYGVGADSNNLKAVDRIYQIKERPRYKPLILLVSSKEEAYSFIINYPDNIKQKAMTLIDRFFPGPLTLVLDDRTAIRIPDHPIALAILKLVQKPIATTSANISDTPDPTDIEKINLSTRVDLIIDGGPSPLKVASTILDVRTMNIFREGVISKAQINEALKKRVLFICSGNTCRSPMAEYFLREKAFKVGLSIEVLSAGVATYNGMPVSEGAKQVLDEQNLDHEHSSSLVNDDLIAWADIILTMTMDHKKKLFAQNPESRHKVFALKEYVNDSNYELDFNVQDPWGGPIEIYRACAEELNDAINKLIHKWSGY